MGNKLLTSRELADKLRVHPVTVRKWANDGILDGVRVGNNWRFQEDAMPSHLPKKVASIPESSATA